MRVRFIALIAVVLLASFTGGCGAKPPLLTIDSQRRERPFSKEFNVAYVSRGEAGAYEIIVVDDDVNAAPVADPSKPIKPEMAPPLRHVLHIRAHWSPLPGTKPDHPSSANASLTWYVFGDVTDYGAHLLTYQGAGFVTVERLGDEARVRIRNARMAPHLIRGDMIDPVGQSIVTANFLARFDSKQVERLTSQLDQAVTAYSVQASGN